jgi:hypothetical protein
MASIESPVTTTSTNTTFSMRYYADIESRHPTSTLKGFLLSGFLEGLDEADLRAVKERPSVQSHIASPKEFDSEKCNYRNFRKQIGLYIITNEEDFNTEKKMIIFVLFYMMKG